MQTELGVDVLPQPDNFTCGPTCLQALYGFYGDHLPLGTVIDQIQPLESGGTLAVVLGCHALRRGYGATVYTYNLHVFDPTWFAFEPAALVAKLKAQAEAREDGRLRTAVQAYCEFLQLGGALYFEDLTPKLIREPLRNSTPILAGLSATYLYRTVREHGPTCEPDDLRGVPVGHFVVLCGHRKYGSEVLVADPLHPNPLAPDRKYWVGTDRLVNAILLGVMTYDANLLIIEPRNRRRAE